MYAWCHDNYGRLCQQSGYMRQSYYNCYLWELTRKLTYWLETTDILWQPPVMTRDYWYTNTIKLWQPRVESLNDFLEIIVTVFWSSDVKKYFFLLFSFLRHFLKDFIMLEAFHSIFLFLNATVKGHDSFSLCPWTNLWVLLLGKAKLTFFPLVYM